MDSLNKKLRTATIVEGDLDGLDSSDEQELEQAGMVIRNLSSKIYNAIESAEGASGTFNYYGLNQSPVARKFSEFISKLREVQKEISDYEKEFKEHGVLK